MVVFGVMIYALVKFRHSQGAIADTTLVHSTKVEIIWTIIPVVILVVMAIPAAKVILMMEDTRNSELSIRVTAYQWKWQYQYMDAGEGIDFFSTLARDSNFARQLHSGIDPKTVPELSAGSGSPMVIPSGTKVRLLLTSQDVIHAWWVPDFGAKRSAIPGFVNELWFRVDPGKEGIYRGQCAALCGRDHGFMPIVVDVRTPDDFKKWVEEQKAAAKQAAAPCAAAPRSAQALSNYHSSTVFTQESSSTMANAHASDTAHHDDHDDHHDQPATGHQALAVRDQPQRHRHHVPGVQPDHVFHRRRDGDGHSGGTVSTRPAARRSGALQSDDHQSCAGHDFRRGHAGVRRSRQLDDSDANRRARHGVAAHEQFQLLDSAVRLHLAVVHVLRARRHAAAGGWTLYPPLSLQTGDSFPMLIFAIHMMGASSIMGAINVIVTIMNMRAPGMNLLKMPLFAGPG